jgi:hypothetical protein
MPEPSPVVRALFLRLRVPPGVAAQVDWVSGTLRVNRGRAEWDAFFRNPLADKDLLLTLEHEAHHVLQICALTYLYEFAVLLHAIVASVLDQHYGDLASLPDDLGEAHEAVRSRLWDLVWRDEDGLSPKDIVESVTWFAEAPPGARDSLRRYLEYLEATKPNTTYRRAFELFAARVASGDERVGDFFPVVSNLSLCCRDPRGAFRALSDAVASGRVTRQTDLGGYQDLCAEIEPGFRGFAWQYAASLPAMPFRFTFTETQRTLTRDPEREHRLLSWLINPSAHIEELFGEALNTVPTLLNPVGDREHEGFSEWFLDARGIRDFGPFRLEDRPYWLQYLAAVSRKYIEDIGPPPPGVTRIRR